MLVIEPVTTFVPLAKLVPSNCASKGKPLVVPSSWHLSSTWYHVFRDKVAESEPTCAVSPLWSSRVRFAASKSIKQIAVPPDVLKTIIVVSVDGKVENLK